MICTIDGRRFAALGFLVAMSLALAGCLLSPGRFQSALDIRKDGRFTFTYAGEIHLLALSKLTEMGGAAEKPKFTPQPCYAEDGSGKERDCTRAESDQQKKDWTDEQVRAAERRKRDAEQMKAVLGGIDPSDPRAAEELAQRVRKQVGWKRITYRGDGLFDVEFALTGRFDHDFAFPTLERFPIANAFVRVSARGDGTLRIDAPGFGPAQAGEPFRGMMGMAAIGDAAKAGAPKLPVIDGRFVITTDSDILSNNTDEGPQADAGGRRLSWAVNMRSQSAPMAVLRLAR